MTSVGVRVSLKVVKPARSANSALHRAPRHRASRHRADARGSPPPRPRAGTDERRHRVVGPRGPSARAARARRRRLLATEGGQHAIGRLAAGLGAGDTRHGAGVPPVDPCRRGLQIQTAERGGERYRADTRVAPKAMSANAASSRTCHTHQLRCQFRLTVTAISASPRSARATAMYSGRARPGFDTWRRVARPNRRTGPRRPARGCPGSGTLAGRRGRSSGAAARWRPPKAAMIAMSPPRHDGPQPKDGAGSRTGVWARRRRREARRDDQADRGGDREPDVRVMEQDPGVASAWRPRNPALARKASEMRTRRASWWRPAAFRHVGEDRRDDNRDETSQKWLGWCSQTTSSSGRADSTRSPTSGNASATSVDHVMPRSRPASWACSPCAEG